MNLPIVSGGRILFEQANADKMSRRRVQLQLEVEGRYAGLLKGSGFWSRFIIRRKIQKKVAELLRAEFSSSQALFVRRTRG